MSALPPTAGPALLGLSHLDHVAIVTPSLDVGSAPYLALGLQPQGPDELVDSQGVLVRAFLLGQSLIELIEPQDPASPLAAFLARRGPGLHHIAFRVGDIEAEMLRLNALGAQFLDQQPRPGRAGSRVAFLHPKWGGGTLIELVEHAAHAPDAG
jgi:methylmalonyl-CoA/ethylmalonyl-CoA epimerase